MKTLKLAVLAACSLAFAAPPAPAQAQIPPPHGTQRQNAETTLGLTPVQKAKLGALAQNANRQMMAINADQSLTFAARRTKMRAVGQTVTFQMMALLTPAQRAKAKVMRQRAQAKGWQYDRGTGYRYRFEDLSSPQTPHL